MKYTAEEVRAMAKMVGDEFSPHAGLMLTAYAERIKADARPVAQGEFDAEARSHARMIHDFPRLSAFFQKHALGSKLPTSCFACGHVGERAITHAELSDIYVCKTCAERIAKSPAQSADASAHPTTNSPKTDSKLVDGAVAQGEAAWLERLKDPATVHALMLRGVIAIPSIRSMVDLRGEVPNGEEVQLLRIAELQEQLAAQPRAVPDDKARLDLLQNEIVDTIYMDDGRIIDVRGLDVRKAIDEFAAATSPGESE